MLKRIFKTLFGYIQCLDAGINGQPIIVHFSLTTLAQYAVGLWFRVFQKE